MGFANLPILGVATTNGCLRLVLTQYVFYSSLLIGIEHFLR